MTAEREFSLLAENAAELGIPLPGQLNVRRVETKLRDGRSISAIQWGGSPPRIALLHGGGQNAHTWDSVSLALDMPLIALDLPGHGHSGPPQDHDNIIQGYASDIQEALAALAPGVATLVGMSAGGLTALSLVAANPGRFEQLILVDILPGPDPTAAAQVRKFLDGPELFDSLDEMVERAIAFNPRRSAASLRRGVIHNACQRAEGKWQWRHQRHRRSVAHLAPEVVARQYEALWQSLGRIEIPLSLVRGMAPGSVVTDAQEARLRQLRSDARVLRIEGAGHSVQGDAPLELARHIREMAA